MIPPLGDGANVAVMSAGLFALAAGEIGAVPDKVSEYGPWAIAFVILLWAFKDVVLQAIKRPIPAPNPTQPATDDRLATALDKLSMVLERMEHDAEKGQDEILALLHAIETLLGRLDYRTMEIREKVVGVGPGPHS